MKKKPFFLVTLEHTHQIEVDTVVHQIVLPWFYIFRRTKIHSVLFAHILNLLICTREPNDSRVELAEVFAEDFGGVTGWIAGNEYGTEDGFIV